jgi:hypothetical protein
LQWEAVERGAQEMNWREKSDGSGSIHHRRNRRERMLLVSPISIFGPVAGIYQPLGALHCSAIAPVKSGLSAGRDASKHASLRRSSLSL